MEIDPSLKEYIAQCRAAGMSEEEIRSSLLDAGWAPEHLAAAFPPGGLTPAAAPDLSEEPAAVLTIEPEEPTPVVKPRVRRGKRGLVLAGIIALALLLLGGGVVALAEQGYMPAVSKIYRKTALPFIWKGTNANAPLSMAKVLLNSSDQERVQSDTTFSLHAYALSEEKKVSWKWFPDSRQFSDVEQFDEENFGDTEIQLDDEATTTIAPSTPEDFLPVTLDFKVFTQYDRQKGSQGRFEIDLGEWYANHPEARDFIPWLEKIVTAEGIILPNDKQASVRSNLIPYLEGDANKWLQFDVPDSVVEEYKDPKTSVSDFTQEEQEALIAAANELVKDQGIKRRENKPYAHYQIQLNKEVIARLKSNPSVKPYLDEWVGQESETDFNWKADLWVHPRSGRLHYLDINGFHNFSETNSGLKLEIHEKLRYGSSDAVAAPPKNAVIQESGSSYLEKAFERIMNQLMGGSVEEDITPINEI